MGRLERLVALLGEKRQATVSHAVTKGLDHSAPMKDSGIDWLGEVPAHWEVKRLRHVGSFKSGAGFPDDEQGLTEGELPFYKVKDLAPVGPEGELAETDHYISRATAKRLGASIFPADAIVFAKVGAALLLNRFRQLSRECCIDNNMMCFVLRADLVSPKFMQLALSRIDFADLVNPGAVPSLNAKQVNDIPFALPPMSEQESIRTYLMAKTEEISKGISQGNGMIATLKERRAALISAAVTGQIPLSEMDHAPAEAAE